MRVKPLSLPGSSPVGSTQGGVRCLRLVWRLRPWVAISGASNGVSGRPFGAGDEPGRLHPVSYTHLTLPTILLV